MLPSQAAALWGTLAGTIGEVGPSVHVKVDHSPQKDPLSRKQVKNRKKNNQAQKSRKNNRRK